MSHESISNESILVAFTTLLRKPAYRNILGAIVTYYLMAYGAMAFVVSLMIRVHGESVARAGAAFGVVTTVGVALGGILGGGLADRLAARNIARLAVFPAWGLLGALPFYEVALWSRSFPAMLVLLSLATTLLAAVVPAMFAALHVVCGSRRRAFSVAAAFLFVNLLGIGLGPTLSGFLSDRLGALYGAGEGLRDALMIVTAVLVPASYLMLRAARHLQTDSED
jgi:MFS family permease